MTYALLFCHRDLGANRLGEINTGTFIHLTHLKVLYEIFLNSYVNDSFFFFCFFFCIV